MLAATLRCAQIGALNNLGAPHKSERVRKLIEGRGCRLLFPPPYSSPDFSPIREAFSKFKSLLQKAQARAREALVEALGVAVPAGTARYVWSFFEHGGGYHLPVYTMRNTL